jgi:hypothetical protein
LFLTHNFINPQNFLYNFLTKTLIPPAIIWLDLQHKAAGIPHKHEKCNGLCTVLSRRIVVIIIVRRTEGLLAERLQCQVHFECRTSVSITLHKICVLFLSLLSLHSFTVLILAQSFHRLCFLPNSIILDQLCDCQLSRKDSVPWSQKESCSYLCLFGRKIFTFSFCFQGISNS